MLRNQKRSGGVVPLRSTALVSRSQAKEEDSPLTVVLKGALAGLLTTALTGILLISAVTAVAYANPDPAALLTPLALTALLPSAFAGGFVCAKRVGEAPLLCGVVCGGMITVLMMLLSLILRGLPSADYAFWQSALLHALTVLFCVLGAFAEAVKKRPKPGKRRFG